MFSSSVGRVGRSAHSLSLPVFTLKGCCPARTSTTSSYRALPCRSHQRRHSSSKPSSPSDGPRRLAQQEGAPAAASTRAKVDSEKRSTGRVGRRKAKDVAAEATIKGKDEALINLPSVPSTHHLHPADVAVSAFFSLHRPISVTSSVPPSAHPESFDNIFTPRSKSLKPSQVVSTLSSAVDALEAASQHDAQQTYDEDSESDLRAAVSSASVSNDPNGTNSPHHLDSPSGNSPLQFPSHLLSGRYKPFSPPSAPVPLNDNTISTSHQSSGTLEPLLSATLKKSYSTILTILESTHPNGSKTYSARTSPVVADEEPQADATPPIRFLERMRARHERWQDYRRGRSEGWYAISVKRQRKLKMKKHKYKKLMRKTRNLRRRLDRN